MRHYQIQAQLDRTHRQEMQARAHQRMIAHSTRRPRRGPVYGAALAGLGQVLVMVGETLRAEYGEMVERREQTIERFEQRGDAIRQTSEVPAV